MSVIPLYNDKDSLMEAIRLKDAVEPETLAIIDTAISSVRLDIFNRIGRDRAMTIAGYSSVSAPSTDEECLRKSAEILEIYMVNYELIPHLPMFFLAGKSSTDFNWNNETKTKESEALKEFRNMLADKIEKLIGQLQSTPVTTGNIKVSIIGRTTPYLIDDYFPGIAREVR